MESLEAVDVVKKLGRGCSGTTIGPVSLRVELGTVTALVGRSGFGKSTVLNSMAGLMRPSAGRVIFEGDDSARFRPATGPVAARSIRLRVPGLHAPGPTDRAGEHRASGADVAPAS
ncbi:MAG: ATP-binding cassette domain-containing protein [Actinomycetales bacterium]|nr:ATP-binding cassette domain-containing protein [Actinomycetales bacterium]